MSRQQGGVISTELLLAAEIIEGVMAALDTREQTCDCCGLNVKHSFREAQAHEQLGAAVTKCKRWARELASGPVTRHEPDLAAEVKEGDDGADRA